MNSALGSDVPLAMFVLCFNATMSLFRVSGFPHNKQLLSSKMFKFSYGTCIRSQQVVILSILVVPKMAFCNNNIATFGIKEQDHV